jgi:hypothetical protein
MTKPIATTTKQAARAYLNPFARRGGATLIDFDIDL